MKDLVFGLWDMAVNTCFNQSLGFNIQNLDIISLKYYGHLTTKCGILPTQCYLHSYHIARPLEEFILVISNAISRVVTPKSAESSGVSTRSLAVSRWQLFAFPSCYFSIRQHESVCQLSHGPKWQGSTWETKSSSGLKNRKHPIKTNLLPHFPQQLQSSSDPLSESRVPAQACFDFTPVCARAVFPRQAEAFRAGSEQRPAPGFSNSTEANSLNTLGPSLNTSGPL